MVSFLSRVLIVILYDNDIHRFTKTYYLSSTELFFYMVRSTWLWGLPLASLWHHFGDNIGTLEQDQPLLLLTVAWCTTLCSAHSLLLIYLSLEANHIKRQEGKLGRIIVPVAMDSTQQEALLMLRKLKVRIKVYSLERVQTILSGGCVHF